MSSTPRSLRQLTPDAWSSRTTSNLSRPAFLHFTLPSGVQVGLRSLDRSLEDFLEGTDGSQFSALARDGYAPSNILFSSGTTVES